MTINKILEEKKMSKYRLSKDSGVPYMTLNDICSGKTSLEKCSAETVYKLAKALDVSMEDLMESYVIPRTSFDLFKSNVCHRLKELQDIDFLIETLEGDYVITYYKREWYPECLYTLAMVDYISRINNVPLCDKYDFLRKTKLDEIVYPSGVIAESLVSKDESIKEKAVRDSIPEFIRFNIVESEVRNVI